MYAICYVHVYILLVLTNCNLCYFFISPIFNHTTLSAYSILPYQHISYYIRHTSYYPISIFHTTYIILHTTLSAYLMHYRPSASPSYEVSSHVNNCLFRQIIIIIFINTTGTRSAYFTLPYRHISYIMLYTTVLLYRHATVTTQNYITVSSYHRITRN